MVFIFRSAIEFVRVGKLVVVVKGRAEALGVRLFCNPKG